MLFHPYHDQIVRERQRELRRPARRLRLAEASRPPRRIRRAVGRSMIRIGNHLAAEPGRNRARSR